MLVPRDRRFDILCVALGAALLLTIPGLMPWLIKLLPWQWRPVYWCLTIFAFCLAMTRSAAGIFQGLRQKEKSD
jgi:hypothetical protein